MEEAPQTPRRNQARHRDKPRPTRNLSLHRPSPICSRQPHKAYCVAKRTGKGNSSFSPIPIYTSNSSCQ